ncbi:hypothetical protein ABVK25_010811 [Lepraria finkii]|uniref:Uncharacterized protein n=1 Tax=Lepraria finkii TaxID=1340010 RepID=A0ABR4ATE0_9LECA
MALEWKEQTPSTRPAADSKPIPVPWQTPEYNDEATLLHLRFYNPKAKWADIGAMFNSIVPPNRQRTTHSIASKGYSLVRADNGATAYNGTTGYNGEMSSNSHFVPTNVMESQSNEDIYNKSTVLPYQPWQDPTEHMEMLGSSYGMVDVDGYTSIIAEEMETLEFAKQMALEAASGTSKKI